MIPAALAALALIAWLLAAGAALKLLRFRIPGRNVGWYALRGAAFFRASNFTPEAAPTLRWLRIGFVVFFVAIFALVGYAILETRPR